MGLQQAVDRGFKQEVALLVGEAHGQLTWGELTVMQSHLDNPVLHFGRDAIPRPAWGQRAILQRLGATGQVTIVRAVEGPASMPGLPSFRLVGRCDCSTIQMISSLSDAGYLIRRLPHPRSRFFGQPDFQRQIGHAFLPGTGFAAQMLHLASGCGAGSVAGQAALAHLHKLLRPGVMQAMRDAFLGHISAMLSLPRRPSSTMRIFSSSEKCRRVCLRMSLITRSAGALAGDFFKELGHHLRSFVTMTKPQPFLYHNLNSVPLELTGNSWFELILSFPIVDIEVKGLIRDQLFDTAFKH